MALIDKTDPLWPRVSVAFAAVQGPVPDGMAQDDFAVAGIMGFIMSVVKQNETVLAFQPKPDAIAAAVQSVDTAFQAQIPVAPAPVTVQAAPAQPIGG